MKTKLIIASIVLATTIPSISMAGEKKQAGTGPNPFSDCGIGAALFTDNKVLAVTSNVIWDVGTTAVTSATASPETCQGKTVTAAKFILDSYDSLAEETARGQGEHLASLMNILDVAQQDRAAVIANLRAQISNKIESATYASASKTEKSSQYYASVIAAINAV